MVWVFQNMHYTLYIRVARTHFNAAYINQQTVPSSGLLFETSTRMWCVALSQRERECALAFKYVVRFIWWQCWWHRQQVIKITRYLWFYCIVSLSHRIVSYRIASNHSLPTNYNNKTNEGQHLHCNEPPIYLTFTHFFHLFIVPWNICILNISRCNRDRHSTGLLFR